MNIKVETHSKTYLKMDTSSMVSIKMVFCFCSTELHCETLGVVKDTEWRHNNKIIDTEGENDLLPLFKRLLCFACLCIWNYSKSNEQML